MASIRVAIDKINSSSSDLQVLNTFAEKLRAAGHNVTTHGRGPNKIQRAMENKSNKCDVMIQIAGGKCLGTLVDFYIGLGKYYYASAGGFAYYKCWDPNWKSYKAHDDTFSNPNNLKPYKGKTLPEIYKIMNQEKKLYYGHGNTADEIASTFISSMGGSSGNTSTDSQSSGTSILELVKQVCSDWDKLGCDIRMNGRKVSISRANPEVYTDLNQKMISNNSIQVADYDPSTPNKATNGGTTVKDQYLIDRFGEVELEECDEQVSQCLQVAKRGHGHNIQLKCLPSSELQVGKWVNLQYPNLDIKDRKYYISKLSNDEEMQNSITLEDGPPSRYVEITEEVTDETDADTDTTEE